MSKKVYIQRIIRGSLWTLGIALFWFLTGFVLKKADEQKCIDVKILIPGVNNLVERQDIDHILRETSGVLIGRKLKDINLYKLEEKLNKNPYISQTKIYADVNGIIRIEITQKQPVLRIINKFGNDFYIDSEGKKMPISSNFTPKVLVANGNITEKLTKTSDTIQTALVKNLFKIAEFVSKSNLWSAQAVQLYANQEQDILMIPRVGSQIIIFGDASSLEHKFEKLLVFYQKAMPKVGWHTYKSINLKFARQIVCVKNDSATIAKYTPSVKKMQETQKTVQDLIQKEIQKK